MGHEALAAALAGCVMLPGVRACLGQSIFNIGVVPGGTQSSARAVSADGSVVAATVSGDDGWPSTRDYRWTMEGGLQDLGAPLECEPYDISSDGTTIVGRTDHSGCFRWTESGGFSYLPSAVSTVQGTNFDGSVVVGDTVVFPEHHALRWSIADGVQDIGPIPNGYATATGVSDDGATVVGDDWSDGYQVRRAFIWTADAGMHYLAQLPGRDASHAQSINRSGTLVLGWSWLSAVSDLYAVKWSWRGIEDLGRPDGYSYTQAYAANNDGSLIVGFGVIVSGDTTTARALVWSPLLHGPRDLQDYLDSLGVDTTGWQLEVALDTSADGRVIVGVGHFNGNERGWVVTIPSLGTCCNDFDGDGNLGTDADIAAFFACLSGSCCPTCCSADFNGDGDLGTDADIESFFRVLSGGSC